MNYKIIIFFVLLCSPSIIDVFAQEGSRNLTAEYCANNWKVDPVRCSQYVPKDYQSSQNQVIPQNNVQTNNVINCPSGTHYGTDGYGPTCISDQIVSSPSSNVQNNSSSSNHPSNNPLIWVGIVLMFVVVLLVKKFRRGSTSTKTSTYESLTRRGWTELEKEEVRIRQAGKCNKCGRPPPRWEYHHRDGNRSNNSLRNCEGLCPNCHSVRTHDE